MDGLLSNDVCWHLLCVRHKRTLISDGLWEVKFCS